MGVSRIRLRALLWVGLALIAAGSTLSFVAGSVGVLLVGQAFTGAASSIVMAAGVAAAAAWSEPANRGRVVAWTLVGAPAAWVVAMPVIGVAAQADWHLAFAVPAAAAGAAGVALARVRARGVQPVESSLRSVLSHRSVPAWTIGEMLAYAAWSGVLVYVGALFVESYGTSPSRVGIALGLGAAAYLPGPFVAGRWATRRNRRALLAAVTLVLAVATVAFGTLRVGPTFTAVGFGVLCFLGGTRVYLGSTVGLDLVGDMHTAAMSIRAAAAQVGWILGGLTGGAALAFGGYAAMGLVLGALFAVGALLHARAITDFIPRGSARATRPELLRRAAAPAEAR